MGLQMDVSCGLNIAMSIEALNRACKALGSQNALATALGIESASISGWRERNRIPAERCIAIEQATGGIVTRHDLRPDIFGPAPAEPSKQEARDAA